MCSTRKSLSCVGVSRQRVLGRGRLRRCGRRLGRAPCGNQCLSSSCSSAAMVGGVSSPSACWVMASARRSADCRPVPERASGTAAPPRPGAGPAPWPPGELRQRAGEVAQPVPEPVRPPGGRQRQREHQREADAAPGVEPPPLQAPEPHRRHVEDEEPERGAAGAGGEQRARRDRRELSHRLRARLERGGGPGWPVRRPMSSPSALRTTIRRSSGAAEHSPAHHEQRDRGRHPDPRIGRAHEEEVSVAIRVPDRSARAGRRRSPLIRTHDRGLDAGNAPLTSVGVAAQAVDRQQARAATRTKAPQHQREREPVEDRRRRWPSAGTPTHRQIRGPCR